MRIEYLPSLNPKVLTGAGITLKVESKNVPQSERSDVHLVEYEGNDMSQQSQSLVASSVR